MDGPDGDAIAWRCVVVAAPVSIVRGAVRDVPRENSGPLNTARNPANGLARRRHDTGGVRRRRRAAVKQWAAESRDRRAALEIDHDDRTAADLVPLNLERATPRRRRARTEAARKELLACQRAPCNGAHGEAAVPRVAWNRLATPRFAAARDVNQRERASSHAHDARGLTRMPTQLRGVVDRSRPRRITRDKLSCRRHLDDDVATHCCCDVALWAGAKRCDERRRTRRRAQNPSAPHEAARAASDPSIVDRSNTLRSRVRRRHVNLRPARYAAEAAR